MNEEKLEWLGLKMKYFVLKPKGEDKYAQASRAAMIEYARIIDDTNPALGQELRHWAGREELNVIREGLNLERQE